MHVAEKCNGTIEGRMVHDGKPMRDWLTKEDASGPTVGLDSSMFTSVMDTEERRDVVMADVPTTFTQTELDRSKGQEKTTMKIAGVLVNSSVEECPLECGLHAVCKNGKKVSCVEAL